VALFFFKSDGLLAIQIRNVDALAEVVDALGDVSYYRVLVENKDYREGANIENPFEHQHERLVEIVDGVFTAGPRAFAVSNPPTTK
jgi:hypothetical protein